MAQAKQVQSVDEFDAIIIGAGISGMYQLYRLRELGMSVRVFEAGTDVGGTWYWNRYPGARFDSESYSYGYSFSDELLDEWEWSEHFAPQPETLRYLQYVTEKFDLRPDIQFKTRIKSARYNEENNVWTIESDSGAQAQAKYLITAIGVLSAPYIPAFEGMESFNGPSWHTSDWPREPLELSNKRVGVIGTGATAVQMIPEIAKEVGHLTVFQRTANYCLPSGNTKITEEEQREIKANYQQMFERCKETFGAFVHGFDERATLDIPAAEREAWYEELYNTPGFALWLGNCADIFSNKEANDHLADFVRRKIRKRIDDPEMAKKLIPTDHPFGTKRVPLDAGYYEAYNRDNVDLVDLKAEPLERITPQGIKTSAAEYEFDIIIYATGFDAVTGAFTQMDIYDAAGRTLNEKWADGSKTYLGIQSAGFPNLFTVIGPHNGGTFCNIPRCIEQNVEWVTDCIKYLRENNIERIQASPEAEDAWTEHVAEVVEQTLLPQIDSWFMGANIPGKKRNFLLYAGGSQNFRARCEEIVANGYEGFILQ